MAVTGTVLMEGVRIGFKNFTGAESTFNREGDRNFVVFLDPDTANELRSKGWNVKFPKPRPNQNPDEEDKRDAYLPIEVSFKNVPPKIVMINGNVQAILNEDEVEMLDWAQIENVDLEFRPYNWSVNGQSGVKAYLKTMYATLVTDELMNKYGI